LENSKLFGFLNVAFQARCCCCVRYGIDTDGQLCAEGTVRPRRDIACPGWQASRSVRWMVTGLECCGGTKALRVRGWLNVLTILYDRPIKVAHNSSNVRSGEFPVVLRRTWWCRLASQVYSGWSLSICPVHGRGALSTALGVRVGWLSLWLERRRTYEKVCRLKWCRCDGRLIQGVVLASWPSCRGL
jgi:hypothetical protein